MNGSSFYVIAKKYEIDDDIEKAYQYYLEAVLAEEDGEAMNALAEMYYDGDYVNQNFDKAGRYFGLAYDCNADIEPWTLIIAGSYWERRAQENPENLFLAEKYYHAAADLGVGYGHECLGALYYELGDYDKAYEHLLQMENRNPLGFYYMGRLYDEGHVVEWDIDKAVEYYKKAIEHGSKHMEYFGEDEHSRLARQRLNELSIG